MLVATTNTLQDRKIKDYFGIVSGEAILGANIFKDLFAGIRDIVGGRSKAYEQELRSGAGESQRLPKSSAPPLRGSCRARSCALD